MDYPDLIVINGLSWSVSDQWIIMICSILVDYYGLFAIVHQLNLVNAITVVCLLFDLPDWKQTLRHSLFTCPNSGVFIIVSSVQLTVPWFDVLWLWFWCWLTQPLYSLHCSLTTEGVYVLIVWLDCLWCCWKGLDMMTWQAVSIIISSHPSTSLSKPHVLNWHLDNSGPWSALGCWLAALGKYLLCWFSGTLLMYLLTDFASW